MVEGNLGKAGSRLSQPLLVLLAFMALSLVGLLLLPPIPQDQGYHHFADERGFLGVPNFWNVVSNLPFIAIGAVGLWRHHRDPITIALFLGILLTGFGSAYYHWAPGDDTLLWDRLPMTITFMAIFAYALEERIDPWAGAVMLWPLLALGAVSLMVWRWNDDLRLYGWVQFFPCVALPVMFWLRPAKFTGTSYWIMAAVLYVAAKVAEFTDHAIFSVGSILSGHTLKHLLAAAASYMVLRYFQMRQPVRGPSERRDAAVRLSR